MYACILHPPHPPPNLPNLGCLSSLTPVHLHLPLTLPSCLCTLLPTTPIDLHTFKVDLLCSVRSNEHVLRLQIVACSLQKQCNEWSIKMKIQRKVSRQTQSQLIFYCMRWFNTLYWLPVNRRAHTGTYRIDNNYSHSQSH